MSDFAEAESGPDPFLLVSGDFVRTGGMDMANYQLADHLARREGADVHIVSHRVEEALLASSNVTFHRAPRPAGSHLLGGTFLRRLGQQVARELGGAGKGVRAIVNGGNCALPDVNWVHYLHAAHEPRSGGSLLRRAKVALVHRRFCATEASALRQARVIVANSQRTKADVIRCYGIDEGRIHPIYYGIDPSTFYPAEEHERSAARAALGFPAEKFLVVFIGALGDRRKGFDTLFAAWKSFVSKHRDGAELLVVGQGGELAAWKARAKESGTAESIRFLGFRRDVPQILRASDAMVAPARYEAFGLGVLEALCCRLPAVVSRSAGVSELYPAELNELLLSNPEDAAQLATKLELLISRVSDWRNVMQPFAARLRRHTWEEMGKEICALVAA